uniref:Uncharacterized protein n=1 Tax=viral metagenome TaxID=1070528 RepID=A0A6M3KB23_9ZZZZ
MDKLKQLALRRNSLEAYLTAIFSPHLTPASVQDSTRVTTVYLTLSRPSNDKWAINSN